MSGTFQRRFAAIAVLWLASTMAASRVQGEDLVSFRLRFQQIEPPTFAPPSPPVAPLPPLEESAEGAQCPSREELERGLRPIGELTANILPPAGEMPLKCSQDLFGPQTGISFEDVTTRLWPTAPYAWVAPALCHRPLYFEEPGLERHGHSLCPPLQPVISGAHFLSTVPTLPYRIVAEGRRECTYTLGHYRPGSPAPAMHYRLPRRLDAAIVQGAVATGLVFLIP